MTMSQSSLNCGTSVSRAQIMKNNSELKIFAEHFVLVAAQIERATNVHDGQQNRRVHAVVLSTDQTPKIFLLQGNR